MSNGILDLMADTAVGMFSGNRRLENFEQREKTREDFAPGEMGDFSYNRYMQAFKEARDAAFADSLASDLKTTALGSAVAPYQETYGLVESLVPGGVKPLSEEEREIFQSRRIKTPQKAYTRIQKNSISQPESSPTTVMIVLTCK